MVPVVMKTHPRNVTQLAALLAASCAAMALPWEAAAQARCHVLCVPTASMRPDLVRSHLLGAPRVRSLSSGQVHELASRTNLQFALDFGATTAVPRTSLFASIQWLPTARESESPFTQYAASDVPGGDVRANAPSLAIGAAFALLQGKATGGRGDVSPFVADLYSATARPGGAGAYTHKLGVGLTGNLYAFAWLPRDTLLHGSSLTVIRDYLATGLPYAGYVVPKGERVSLEDAPPVTLTAGLTLPLASANRVSDTARS
jgi:hypothetical protein